MVCWGNRDRIPQLNHKHCRQHLERESKSRNESEGGQLIVENRSDNYYSTGIKCEE